MAKKIEDRLQKNKELAALISNLKGIGGDPPTNVKSPSKPKKAKGKSTDAIILVMIPMMTLFLKTLLVI